MYYSKFFEGHVGAETGNYQYYPNVDKTISSISIYYKAPIKKLTIIGNAVANTLRDCGLTNAKYIPKSGYLYLDYVNSNAGFFICTYANNQNSYSVYNGYNNNGIIRAIDYHFANNYQYNTSPFNCTGEGTFTEGDYKFCVTVKGDTSSTFLIYLGTYNNPTKEDTCLGINNFGIDKRNDNVVFSHYKYINSDTQIFLCTREIDMMAMCYHGSEKIPSEIHTANSLSIDSSYLRYSGEDAYVVLIEQYFTSMGYIGLDKTYINPGLVTNKFYEIDGHIYYIVTNLCVQCTTQVNPTPAPEDLLHMDDE